MGTSGIREVPRENGRNFKCDTVGLNDYNLSGVNIAIFAGCETAYGLENSITYRAAKDNKIHGTIGWITKVNVSSMSNWLESFVYYLTFAYDLKDASALADDEIKYADSRVKNHSIGGDASRTLFNTGNRSVEYEPLPMPNMYQVNDDITFDFYNQDIDNIVTYIKGNHIPEFDLDDYKVHFNDYTGKGETGMIAFQYRIGDFLTDKKVLVYVVDNKVIGIFLNKRPDQKAYSMPMCLDSGISDEELKQLALDDLQVPEGEYTLIDQTISKRFDTEMGRAFYVVITDYEINGYYDSIEYEYDI